MSPLQMLAQLRWPIVLAIVLAASGTAALIYARRDSDITQARLQRAQNDNQRSTAELRRAHLQEGEIRDTIAQFDTLRRTGLIGPERRLAWVETLDAARQRLKIDAVSYEILPQRRLDESTTTELAWMESRMRLSMRMRHGGVLLDMLDDLASVRSAIVQPRSCHLRRASAPNTGIEADCELRWLTLRPEHDE